LRTFGVLATPIRNGRNAFRCQLRPGGLGRDLGAARGAGECSGPPMKLGLLANGSLAGNDSSIASSSFSSVFARDSRRGLLAWSFIALAPRRTRCGKDAPGAAARFNGRRGYMFRGSRSKAAEIGGRDDQRALNILSAALMRVCQQAVGVPLELMRGRSANVAALRLRGYYAVL
jgi:hypothetical protein